VALNQFGGKGEIRMFFFFHLTLLSEKTHSIAVSICFASLLTQEEKNFKRSTNKKEKTGSKRKYRLTKDVHV